MSNFSPAYGEGPAGTQIPIAVDSSGKLILSASTAPSQAQTATLTQVASSATTVVLVAANTNRKGLYIYNDSTAILYVAFAGTASTSVYSFQLPAQGFYEMPAPIFVKTISGIWTAANGNAILTELT